MRVLLFRELLFRHLPHNRLCYHDFLPLYASVTFRIDSWQRIHLWEDPKYVYEYTDSNPPERDYERG